LSGVLTAASLQDDGLVEVEMVDQVGVGDLVTAEPVVLDVDARHSALTREGQAAGRRHSRILPCVAEGY
jgi:hypothetical protein